MRLLLGNVIDQEYGRAIPVVAPDDGLEAFLACGVPDGHLDIEIFIDFDDL